MAFSVNLINKINEYVYGHLPKMEWYNENFYPFIKDKKLREASGSSFSHKKPRAQTTYF